jgi:hypothetical protein
MQFEELDKKIREAAEQHHPAYDEKAWLKMNKLLDKHLPQEKDRRRGIIFFLLFFLLLGGGIWVFISKPWTAARSSDELITAQTKTPNKPEAGNLPRQQSPLTVNQANEGGTKPVITSAGTQNSPISTATVDKFAGSKTTRPTGKDHSQRKLLPAIKKSDLIAKESTENDGNKIKENSSSMQQENTQELVSTNVSGVNREKKQEAGTSPNPIENKEEKKTSAEQTTKTQAHKSGRVKNDHDLALSISTGPDVSKAGNSKVGRTTMVFGLGLAYSFNRFSVQTGVYKGRKLYTANAGDYKLAYQPPPSVKFVSAEADCKVIEIPFDLSYSFGVKKNANWFAGAGLSSYLMKQETYEYAYQNTTTNTSYYRPYQVKNKNKHYFSVLDLSAGYNRNLSKILSFSVQPYLQIPLKGIGAGKVKLNSGGVLFSLGIHPFKIKK